jgi:hypothetical protein
MQSAEQDDPPKHKTSLPKGISPGSGWFFLVLRIIFLFFTKTQTKKDCLIPIKQPFPE